MKITITLSSACCRWKMAEGAVLKQFMMGYSKLGWRLFRAYSGQIFTGQPTIFNKRASIQVLPGDILLRGARRLAGLPVGFADLFGYTVMEITQDMVGRKVPIFTACEVKYGSTRSTKQQRAFIQLINDAGGIAAITRKLDDFLAIVKEWKDARKTRY